MQKDYYMIYLEAIADFILYFFIYSSNLIYTKDYLIKIAVNLINSTFIIFFKIYLSTN